MRWAVEVATSQQLGLIPLCASTHSRHRSFLASARVGLKGSGVRWGGGRQALSWGGKPVRPVMPQGGRSPPSPVRPTDRPTHDRPTDAAGRSTIPLTDRPTVDQTIHQPTDLQPTDRSTNRPTDQPTDRSTDRPTDRPTNRPTDRPTDQPTDRPTSQPTNQPTN